MNTGEKILQEKWCKLSPNIRCAGLGGSGSSMLIARAVSLSLDGLCPLFPQPVSFELGGLFHTLMNRI